MTLAKIVADDQKGHTNALTRRQFSISRKLKNGAILC
jgi:hypothetical protein